ncbi:hypothetical protein I7I53_01763 [Histoplasma capsulatum var. duboisii H88]|uniref:Uncharacterized protein n=1 Tax=Ajellomyces capsulatus (strain H88) TaxID=544711 RepID=A0A8A1LNS9_AJEC8|nr:hypothetical protein I7I53_01763 [Histoplasma capsulatum var. duboisii H88]
MESSDGSGEVRSWHILLMSRIIHSGISSCGLRNRILCEAKFSDRYDRSFTSWVADLPDATDGGPDPDGTLLTDGPDTVEAASPLLNIFGVELASRGETRLLLTDSAFESADSSHSETNVYTDSVWLLLAGLAMSSMIFDWKAVSVSRWPVSVFITSYL